MFKKFNLFSDKVKYHGRVIRADEVELADHITYAIQDVRP